MHSRLIKRTIWSERFFLLSSTGHSSLFICKSSSTNYEKCFSRSERENRFSKRRRIELSQRLRNMACPEMEQHLIPLRAAVKECADTIRLMKEAGAASIDMDRHIVELKARKKRLQDKEVQLAAKDVAPFDRFALDDLLRRRFFYDQSFAIYGGITGLYDFGPMGCAMKANMLHTWRKHFVLEEGMLEVECAMLTPESVLRASGHVERFSDYMVKDVETGECFRADHLIKSHAEKLLEEKAIDLSAQNDLINVLAQLDGFSKDDMQDTIKRFNFKSPITGNDLTEPIAFNLMFPTQIGPTGHVKGFLRPETAQGIFVNFKRLLEFNQGRLPFAAAQIGAGFRNEISPRAGLIRVREFTMCEIEHFVDPDEKDHTKFDSVKDYELTLFSACNQLDGKSAQKMTIGEAVSKKIVANETLGYYMARVDQYLMKVGVNREKCRFRQHLSNEMAHYAKDCWDAECLTSYGWIECVGNADRSCFDLQQHHKATGVKLVAEKRLKQPIKVNVTAAMPVKAAIGKKFKSKGATLIAYLEEMNEDRVQALEKDFLNFGYVSLNVNGDMFDVTPDMVTVKRFEKQMHVKEIVPSVIEPSFGMGRIIYVVLEHAFRQRQTEDKRQYLALKPLIAPCKCSVLPLSGKREFGPVLRNVTRELLKYDISHKVDDSSGSIGRRYARNDEIGIPFGVTVDFDSLNTQPATVTLRDTISMAQVRLPINELGVTVRDLSADVIGWTDVLAKYPRFEQQEATSV